jgi:hypothetical protein
LYSDDAKEKMAWMDSVYILSSVVSHNMPKSCGWLSFHVWWLLGFRWQWIIILCLFKNIWQHKPKKASGNTSEFWDTQEDSTTCENDTRRSTSQSNSGWENK